jgi:hypothetical protein
LAVSAGLLVIDGTIELLRYHAIWIPAPNVQRGLPHTIDFMRGIGLGFLIALVSSGELEGKKRDAPGTG